MDRKEQLIKLISGDLEPQERIELFEEMKQDSSLMEEYEKIKNIWALSTANQTMDELEIERSYAAFRKNKNNGPKVIALNVLKYAAIVVLFFSLGIFSNRFFQVSSTQTALNEVYVPNGQRTELTLSDGSKVWLNSGSSFEFPKSFNENCRLVKLSGEAYFEVQKGKVPFVVSSEYGDIKVLGTKFNVQAYSNMNFQATLEEGKIKFNNQVEETTLAPGQQLTIMRNKKLIVKNVDAQSASLWKKGIISFEQEPLEEIAKKLERHFDIHIELSQRLAAIKFTGEIFGESINDVMDYINKTKPINYTYNKKTRTLKIRSEN